MQSIIPTLDVSLESEEPVHSCCVRRRNSEVLRALLRAPEPLDRDDQKKVVNALAKEQAHQQAFAGQLLGGVVGLVLLLHGFLLYQQFLHPWSTKLLAHFYDAGQFLAAVSFLTSTAAYGTFLARVWQLGRARKRRSRLLLASKAAAATAFLLWTLTLWKAAEGRGEGFAPALKFWWLPCGPSLLLVVLERVWAMVSSSDNDLEALKSQMYNFKSA